MLKALLFLDRTHFLSVSGVCGSQLAPTDAPPDRPVAAADTGLVLFLLCRICDGGTSEK